MFSPAAQARRHGGRLLLHGWVPCAEGMRRTWYATYELFGIVRYKVRAGRG